MGEHVSGERKGSGDAKKRDEKTHAPPKFVPPSRLTWSMQVFMSSVDIYLKLSRHKSGVSASKRKQREEGRGRGRLLVTHSLPDPSHWVSQSRASSEGSLERRSRRGKILGRLRRICGAGCRRSCTPRLLDLTEERDASWSELRRKGRGSKGELA